MSKIECLFTIFPILILMYATFYFMPYFVGKKHIYGVSIDQEHKNYTYFINLDKEFKKFLSLGFIIDFILVFILVFLFDKLELSYFIGIIIFLFYESILYIHVHKKAKKLKSEIYSTLGHIDVDSKLIVDMDFINKKNKLIKKFKILYLIPILFTFGMSIFLTFNYNQLPDLIATHWSINGSPDILMEKSFLNIFKLIGTEFCLMILLYINSPNLKSNSSYSPEEDEKYWIAGTMYNNPNDPSLMVNKRFGLGWTINFGNPLRKILYIAIALFLIFSLYSLIKSLLL